MTPRDEIQKVLWSVQYNTQFRRRADPKSSVVSDQVREKLLPIDPDVAVRTLLEPYDEHDRARRRRAFVKFGAAGMFKQERLYRFFDDTARAEEMLKALTILGRAIGLTNVHEVMLQPPSHVAKHVNEQLQATLAGGECLPFDASCVACLDAATWETTVTAEVRVPRPLEDLATVIEPRNWQSCSDVIEDVHLREFNLATSQWVPSAAVLPLPGQSWSTNTGAGPQLGLFERVRVGQSSGGGFIAEFTNVLNIDFWVTLGTASDEIRVDYSLNQGLQSSVFGQSMPGGLVNDEGYVQATRDPASPATWSHVRMQKTVQFSDLTSGGGAGIDYGELLNYTAPGMLCLWLEDTSELSPCCTTP